MAYVDIELCDVRGRKMDARRLEPVNESYPLHRILATSEFCRYPRSVQALRNGVQLGIDTMVAPGEKISLVLQPA
jgi:hypothetical protein